MKHGNKEKSIKYLGATIGNIKEAVKIRINKTKVVYARLWNRVFNTNIDKNGRLELSKLL